MPYIGTPGVNALLIARTVESGTLSLRRRRRR